MTAFAGGDAKSRSLHPHEALGLYEPLDDRVKALPNVINDRIDAAARETLERCHKGLPSVLRYSVAVSAITFFAIKRLVFPQYPGEMPPPHWAVAIPPLARTLVDCLINVVFIFDNPTANVERYIRGGICKELARYKRLVADHGSDPEWRPYLDGLRAWLDSWEASDPTSAVLLSDDEKTDPERHAKRLWPNPGQLINSCQTERRDFLRLMQAWHYDELSQDSHLSYMGLVRRGSLLNEELVGLPQEINRRQSFYTGLGLYLAFLSEVVSGAQLTTERRLVASIWEDSAGFPEVERLWKRRYRDLLANAPV